MADILELQKKFKDLTDKRDKLSSEKIQLETKISVAKEDLKKDFQTLEVDFKVTTLEEAELALKTLEDEIDTKLVECEEFIKKFEGDL